MSQVNFNNNNAINELYNLYSAAAAGQTAKTQAAQETVPGAKTEAAGSNSSVPQLDTPTASSAFMAENLAGSSSMWAKALSLITQMSAEQRQATRDQKALQTELQIDNINEQADTMRAKAVTQLVLGVVTGAMSIGQGFAGMGMLGAGKSDVYVTCFNNVMKGFGDSVSGINQSVGGFLDADVKEIEAQGERIKAMSDQLDSLDQALKELIQKALSTQNAIQENVNQTRTKILG